MEADDKGNLDMILAKLTSSCESNLRVYQENAAMYDEGLVRSGFCLPQKLIKLGLHHLSATSKQEMDQLVALDLLSGTGIVGVALKEAGFTGAIDAIDGSSEMNSIAELKNVYRKITQLVIFSDTTLPFDDDTYDVIICSGGLSIGHFPFEGIRELFRILKPGGIAVFNSTHFISSDPQLLALNAVADKLKELRDEGKCKRIDEIKLDDAFSNRFRQHVTDYDILHCYSK
ncbi:unnamed protein product [Clavelina lepadiformis]|uniref:Methyltransferase type 11 domain-containing protein n=1 Tax=Clavelina lepadiformis TaxID=159417 RepID=A0ABP0G078_CLALP